MRRRYVLLILLAAGGLGAALLLSMGRDTARDVTQALDLRGDPPFEIRLSGPLWRDRTLRSEDGALDVGYVTGDERLDVLATGADEVPVAEVDLRVDGRLQRRIQPPCPQNACPSRLSLVLAPRVVGLGPGHRRVEVIVRDRKALNGQDVDPHVSVAKFRVNVGRRLPLVREGEPVTVVKAAPARMGVTERRLRAGGLRALTAIRRRGVLDGLLGSVPMNVLQAGPLKVNGLPLGASLLLQLRIARRNVRATVPDYVPAPHLPAGYRAQTVRVEATVLRDLLVDVDLNRRRVIAVEPGPQSQTKLWQPSFAPAPAGAGDED